MFFYHYCIINHSSSRGILQSIMIDLWRKSSSVSFDTTGLIFKKPFSKYMLQSNYFRVANNIVPVGFPDLPGRWEGWPISGNYPWASIGNVYNPLHPGDRVKGITLMSRGLPGPRQFIAEPEFQLEEFFPDLDDPSPSITIEQQDSIREAVKYHGTTVAPWAPPAQFEPGLFIDTIKSFVRQSEISGWISSQRLADSFIALLDTAWTYIRQSKTAAANIQLHALLRQVESYRAGALKPEAYALIRYNTEYLISNLQSQANR
jgi:hypothetical protein